MSTLGVLLAAGTGSRFDGESGAVAVDDARGATVDDNKLLATIDGEPIVVHAARTLATVAATGTIDDLVAVLGHEADRTRSSLATEPFETVENPDFRDGQATSVRRGARVARERGADAVLFALGDMPCVDPDTVTAVVEALAGSDAAIAVPVHDGRRGNPVAFGATYFDDLASLDGDTGGRDLFSEHPVERVPVPDEGIHLDVDTLADLSTLLDRCE